MKFYIFANEKTQAFSANVNDAIYSSTDYQSTREQFDIINKEFKYRNTYLIADLNVVELKQGMFTRPINIATETILNISYLPFFVIGEFHYTEDDDFAYYMDASGKFDPNKTIRHDAVSIKLPGFTQQFKNNHSAILSYINFMDNAYNATMEIKIKVPNANRAEAVTLYRTLGNTIVTKQKLDNQSFSKIEIPKAVHLCYTAAEFDPRPEPKFFDLKNDTESLGIIHTPTEKPITLMPV